jgi:hypothetical protein
LDGRKLRIGFHVRGRFLSFPFCDLCVTCRLNPNYSITGTAKFQYSELSTAILLLLFLLLLPLLQLFSLLLLLLLLFLFLLPFLREIQSHVMI